MRLASVLRWLATATLGAASLVGCEQAAPSPPPKPAGAASSASTAPKDDAAAIQAMLQQKNAPPAAAPGGALPPGHPPMPGVQPTEPGALPASHPPVGGVTTDLKFEPGADWRVVPPASSMRKAQFALPMAEGDSEDGELIVFFFGRGEGGSVEGNIARWRSQVTQSDGSPLPPEAGATETFDAHGMKVTLLDVSGRYAPGAMPGAPSVGPRDGYRMFAAVVETPGGAWFFKATGPTATMEKHREAVKAMLASSKYEGK